MAAPFHLSPFRLCQQTEHALLECWKSTSTSRNPSSLSECYRLVRNFIVRDHWSLFFWAKRARCHGECSSIQGDDRRIFPSTSGRNGRWGCVVSTRCFNDLPWPARSPDLALCDFFLWGYLKSIVYNDRPRTLAHLKANIRNAIAEIPVDMLQRVARNRLNQCIDNSAVIWQM